MMITVAIGLTLAGITFIALMPMFKRNHVDLAYDTTLMVLRNTRHLAITQSHQYFVNFNPRASPSGTMQVTYQPPAVGGGALPPIQQVATYTLPPDISFAVMAGFPASFPRQLRLRSYCHRFRPGSWRRKPELRLLHARRFLAGQSRQLQQRRRLSLPYR